MPPLLLCILLAVVAGWVDTAVYFAIGLFSAHVTGNIVLVAAALRRPGASLLLGALSVPVFIVVAWLAALLGQMLGPARLRTIRTLFAIEGVLLALCLAAGAIHPGGTGSTRALLLGMFAVAAMAVQNATNRLLLPRLPSTAVMTSNVSQLAVDLAALVRPAGATRQQAVDRLAHTGPAVLAFAAGCGLGAAGYAVAAFWSLAVPFALVLVVAATARPDRS